MQNSDLYFHKTWRALKGDTIYHCVEDSSKGSLETWKDWVPGLLLVGHPVGSTKDPQVEGPSHTKKTSLGYWRWPELLPHITASIKQVMLHPPHQPVEAHEADVSDSLQTFFTAVKGMMERWKTGPVSQIPGVGSSVQECSSIAICRFPGEQWPLLIGEDAMTR